MVKTLSEEHKQKIIEGRKQAAASYVTFDISKNTRIAAYKHGFEIDYRKNEDSDWVGQYYYQTLQEAFVGLLTKKSRKRLGKKVSSDLEGLLQHLQSLTKYVDQAAKRIQDTFDASSLKDQLEEARK